VVAAPLLCSTANVFTANNSILGFDLNQFHYSLCRGCDEDSLLFFYLWNDVWRAGFFFSLEVRHTQVNYQRYEAGIIASRLYPTVGTSSRLRPTTNLGTRPRDVALGRFVSSLYFFTIRDLDMG
jgi:hypothetical protein